LGSGKHINIAALPGAWKKLIPTLIDDMGLEYFIGGSNL
jgi:hypothetical protein